LLASASFLSIGFFETYTPGTNADPSSVEPDTEVIIRIKPNQLVEFKLKGKRNETIRYHLNDSKSMSDLDQKLASLKSNELKLNQILLSADDEVDYQDLSGVMGHIQQTNLPLVVGEF
jgi:biopolymer transport protein ExbD